VISRMVIQNFKRFDVADLELGSSVVLIGPNNAGKTTALQAMALWHVGVQRWFEKRKESSARKRIGVTINRRDLTSIPVPNAKQLWRNLKTHFAEKAKGKPQTRKIYMTITAEGVHKEEPWSCGLDFYYANEESFYCRMRDEGADANREAAASHKLVYLPPMSGLADREHRKEPGEIAVLIGEGQTAQVLRNLCWQLSSRHDSSGWEELVERVEHAFHVRLLEPRYIPERGELTMTYREGEVELDISSVGRGCQQVILLLSYMLAHPGAVLMLDEPDAHLEILRQRDIYNVLTEIADRQNSQIVAASHSEVVLQEAGERDVVIAFLGKPHRVDAQGRAQLRKALERIPLADSYMAEQKGWILYLEGSTDLAILRTLARRLEHPAWENLDETIPVHYLGSNQPQSARDHFFGLREAKGDLVGIAIYDRLDRDLPAGSPLNERQWSRRELENYLVTEESLSAFVRSDFEDAPLLNQSNERVFRQCLEELVNALRVANRPDPWGPDIKVTDEFLDPLFKNYYQTINLPQKLFKRDYHRLAEVIPLQQLDPEITLILDAIHETARQATPRE